MHLEIGKRYQFTYQAIDMNRGSNPYYDVIVTGIYEGATIVPAKCIRFGGVHKVILSCGTMPGTESTTFLLSALIDAKEA